jgi:hypothetical protein
MIPKELLFLFQICKQLVQFGWRTATLPTYATTVHKSKVAVTFNGLDNVSKTSDWVKANGLGGVGFYTIDNDDFKDYCGCGTYPALRVINRALGNSAPGIDKLSKNCSVLAS